MDVRQRLALILLTAVLRCAPAGAQDMRRPKKLIATGWDMPDTQRLRENLAEMEKRPFDGVVLRAEGRRDDKKPVSLRWAFRKDPWRQEWFEHCVQNLQACKSGRLTDNFLSVNANPGDVDWFDDAGWASIVEHWRIAARVARRGGCKGLLFDPEPYAPPHAQFRYAAQPQAARHSFQAYYAKAAQRGREVMAAIAKEYPDITLFCYFMNSVCGHATGRADPRLALESSGYGLLPAFLDGWLDLAGPQVTFVDGCESAYLYNSPRQYLEAGTLIKGACQELVSPANRARYRARVQVSFGIYLDAYWNPKDSEWGRWYVDGRGRPRVERLRSNLVTALRVADEYVWVYGEKFRWWPTPNPRVRKETWPRALPGCEAALAYARDPVGYARDWLARRRQAGTLANRVRNGDFAPQAVRKGETTPAEWHAWQDKDSHGTFTRDPSAGAGAPGAARAAGVAGGCFLQHIPAKPGERYVVRAMRKLQGAGRAWVRVRWQTPESAWTAEVRDVVLHCAAPPEKWGEILGVVEVPRGAGQLVVLLSVSAQTTDKDVAWFDDVVVCRLE